MRGNFVSFCAAIAKFNVVLVGVFSAVFSFAAHCESVPPPTIAYDFGGTPVATKTDPVSFLRLGTYRVTLEKTTLSKVVAEIGKGEIEQQGDGGESIYWLCYTASKASNPYRVWIIASGEMGGPEHFVTEVIAQTIDVKGGSSTGCPELPARFRRANINNGVWLGTNTQQLKSGFGNPVSARGDMLTFLYERNFNSNDAFRGNLASGQTVAAWDASSWLVVLLSKQRVTTLAAGRITTF